ncbi:hypothetical protein GUJ93_ZPchr0011g28135 [Zizania palustris]|uniref:DUF1409 domain-containing protein n=1 Tax=Zizania palustris TaxID=103762 RepID=A0A8J5WF62_ZIZPA|nr:hypothetical protein GUJ93_ZPchr0011g28135 [Zizania palustris]
MIGLLAYEPLASASRSDLGEVDIAPIPSTDVIGHETNLHDATKDVSPPDCTRPTNSFVHMFPFDISQYLQDEEVTDARQPIMTQPSLEVKEILLDLLRHLSDLVETLMNDSGPTRARFNDILNSLPSKLVDVLTPMVYLEYHGPVLQRA